MYRVIMKTTRILLIALLLASSICSVWAANSQRIIPLGDKSYETIDSLFSSLGMTVPSSSRPWSEAEFVLYLDKIDENMLSSVQKTAYESLANKYKTNRNESFKANIEANLEVYAHTNEQYNTTNDWQYNFEKRKPLMSISMGLSPFSSMYAEMDATLGTSKFSSATTETTGRQQWFEQKITTNLFMFNTKNNGSFDGNIPYRAYLSFGGSNWNLQIGRERLNWGTGKSGNLIIGDQLQYHNMLRFTGYNDMLKFTFLASFFPHPNEIYDVKTDTAGNRINTARKTYSQDSAPTARGLKMFLGHMLELSLFDNRLSFSLSENIMYQSDEANLDLRYFSPMMIFHNFYNPKNMNSILGLEAIWAPANGFNVYLQFALDDIALSVETTNKPNAIGLIGGVKWSAYKEIGLISATLEGAYTSPYMYLRSKEASSSQTDAADTLDFIVAIRRWFSGDGDNIVYDTEYLGYRYGNDAIVGLLNVEYNDLDHLKANANLFFMAHGEKDKNSQWKMGADLEEGANRTPFGNAEYIFAAGLGAQYGFETNTAVAVQTTFLNSTSKGIDFQLALSATHHLH